MPPGPAFGCGSRFSAFSAHQARMPILELVGHRLAEPCVQAADLADRVGLHCAKVDVVEAFIGAARAELHRPLIPADHCVTLSSPR